MGIADSISIHAPRTGSDGGCRRGGGSHHISIHAPRTGSDVSRGLSGVLHRQFQSTLPARGATRERSRFCPVCVKFQSTLPARGATVSGGGTRQWQTRFQSTLPARGATYESTWRLEDELFQSTLPARGATVRHNTGLHSQGISIHAPRTGSDCSANNSSSLRRNFNPRSPHGERHGAGDGQDANAGISIHAPRTGSDASNRC